MKLGLLCAASIPLFYAQFQPVQLCLVTQSVDICFDVIHVLVLSACHVYYSAQLQQKNGYYKYQDQCIKTLLLTNHLMMIKNERE